MRPEGTRVWRKNGRPARRGVKTGRRHTHKVVTQQHVQVDIRGAIRVNGKFWTHVKVAS